MTKQDDPRLITAKAMPITDVIARLGISGLKTEGWELSGPCPSCGTTGHNPKSGRSDRFNVNLRTNAFLCRKCGIKGGDQIALVMAVENIEFKAALTWLCGDRPAAPDPAEQERRRRIAAEAERKQQAEQEKYRRRAIKDARRMWQASRPGNLGVVRAYLTARGLRPDRLPVLPIDLQFIVDHPYVKKIDGALQTLHSGPCMIAAIRRPDGSIAAVHQTWVASAPPHGKAKILHGETVMPSKMVRGSKKGGAIRLFTPETFDTLVMGEGIETTLTAAAAWRDLLPPDRTAYWAGVDLGNMSGRMAYQKGKRHSGRPDMDDRDAFVPPPWTRRLIFIQDGDSDPKATRAKLECGLRRAMALVPGLRGQIVHAGDGVDLNDVLVKAQKEEDSK